MDEKDHQNVNDVQSVVEEVTGSEIVYKQYERNEQRNEKSIQHNNEPLVKDLSKHCSVYLKRVDLTWPEMSRSVLHMTSRKRHRIGNSNSKNESKPCGIHLRRLDLTLPEISHSENTILSQKVDQIEKGNSVIENRIEDSFENIKSSIRNRLGLIFDSMNETAALVKAAVKKRQRNTLRSENTSELYVRNIKILDYCMLEQAVKAFETVDNNSNVICHSDYKCEQCCQVINSDIELYDHLCCGKREKGYICYICEKIMETMPKYKSHLNYHYKLISETF